MSNIIELFGVSTSATNNPNWSAIVNEQKCSFLGRTCIKIRKSQPEISIGTCSVLYGKAKRPIVICPFRLLERKQIFNVGFEKIIQQLQAKVSEETLFTLNM